MSALTWTKRITAVTVAGAAIAGIGMTSALAQTPSSVKDVPVQTWDMTELTNLTPYVWHLEKTDGNYNVAAPGTVEPGHTASWSPYFTPGGSSADYVYYTFVDGSGMGHTVKFEDYVGSTGDWDHVVGTGEDGIGEAAHDSTRFFRMAFDRDNYNRHQDAVWTAPTKISIDAATDPDAASTAVNDELPRAIPDLISWKPVSNTPTYNQTQGVQASSTLRNDSSEPARLEVSSSTSAGQETSLGEEVTASIGGEVFGVAAKVAVSVTSDQTWGSSDEVDISDASDIDPGDTGYLTKATVFGTLTGTLAFTTPEGVQYTLTNVAITRGDMVNPNGLPFGIAFSAIEAPSAPAK